MLLSHRIAAAALLLLSSTAAVFAQSHLTPAEISNATANYTTLLPKFENGDILTCADAAGIYYGAAKQKGFNPSVSHTSMLQAYETGNMLQAHQLAIKGLKSDPTNLTLLFKAYASAIAGNDTDAKAMAPKLLSRISNVCEAIFNSGLGVSETSPYLYTHPSDVEEFLLKFIQPSSIEGKAKLGDLDVYKVILNGIEEPVYLYFGQYK